MFPGSPGLGSRLRPSAGSTHCGRMRIGSSSRRLILRGLCRKHVGGTGTTLKKGEIVKLKGEVVND